uniref:DRBM domain-containing protein n=1 Tax=Haemonchus contortus TaxID=6289 RepID=A0A7I4XY03_HAECO
MDFCNYLFVQGLLKASEVPALEASSLQAYFCLLQKRSIFGNSAPGSFFKTEASEESSFDEKQSGANGTKWDSASQSAHDKYVTQKAEEIAQSESVDLKQEIHGGWTMENSKKGLERIPAKDSSTPDRIQTPNWKEANNCRTYVAEATIFVPQLRKPVSGRGQGSSKKVAESGCSMGIVRQLFHLGILAEFKGERKKTVATTLPEIPITIPPELAERVKNYVTNSGVEPITIDPNENVTTEAPKSLLTNCKLDQFPDSEVMPPGNISWAPPMQNWNPWRASNIDEPPLAFYVTSRD